MLDGGNGNGTGSVVDFVQYPVTATPGGPSALVRRKPETFTEPARVVQECGGDEFVGSCCDLLGQSTRESACRGAGDPKFERPADLTHVARGRPAVRDRFAMSAASSSASSTSPASTASRDSASCRIASRLVSTSSVSSSAARSSGDISTATACPCRVISTRS